MISVCTDQSLLDIAEAKEAATDPRDFLDRVDALMRQPRATIAYPFEMAVFDPLVAPSRRQAEGSEASNAVSVYECLGVLDRTNAADGRLWTWLAFSTYRDYMEKRWPLEGKNWRSRVESRWLMASANRDRLVRHGIARLWWCAHLTFDRRCRRPLSLAESDPHAYTRVALGNEDRFLAIFDRDLGSVPELRFALLDFLASAPDVGEAFTRELVKGLVSESAVRNLVTLQRPALDRMIAEAAEICRARLAGGGSQNL